MHLPICTTTLLIGPPPPNISKARDPSEVFARHDEGARIIPQVLWERVRRRAASVSAKYKGTREGAAPGNKTTYPLSGILLCGKCQTPMTIMGSSSRYYRCADRAKRGICDNALSVREEVARACIFRALRDALFTPEGIEYLRKHIAERLGELARRSTAEERELNERISRTETHLENLVRFVAEGNRSQTTGAAIKDREAQLRSDQLALAALKDRAMVPARLPTPEAILRRAQELDRVFRADPTRLREKLLRFFEKGRILLHPQADGTYVAMTALLPLVVLDETKNPGVRRPRDPSLSSVSCAGRI